MFPWWHFTKIDQADMAAWGLSVFPLHIYIEKIKIVLLETTRPISIKLGKNNSLVTLYQDCTSRMIRQWIIENLKKIFLSETTWPIST